MNPHCILTWVFRLIGIKLPHIRNNKQRLYHFLSTGNWQSLLFINTDLHIGDFNDRVKVPNEDEVKRIKTVLTKIEEARGVCFDALVILLLEMMKSSSLLKKYIWEDVMELAKRGFKDTYLGEVKKYFCEETFLTNEEKIILLESVLKKGEIDELYNKEIVQIFDSIDWSKDKDRFHELIVIVQRQNMELSGQLMRQFQLKYERRKL